MPDLTTPHVAVIGGGYAGMASAVTLAQHGIAVSVLEAGKVLGGRARRIDYQHISIDNGQHILSGAYCELRNLMQQVGVDEKQTLLRLPLHLEIAPNFRLHAPPLPAPLHLAFALLRARGLTWRDRWAAILFMQRLKKQHFKLCPDSTVQSLLQQHQQSDALIQHLWEPLCVAALNTPLHQASAQVFANVLRDALFGDRAASDLLLPQTDLSALFPEPAAAWLKARKHRVDTGVRATSLQKSGQQFALYTSEGDTTAILADAVICAIGPHQLAHLASDTPALQTCLANSTAHFAYEPIMTLYLQYPTLVKLPYPMTGQSGKMVQWFFDRQALTRTPGLIAAVISASGEHQQLDHNKLTDIAHQQLQALTGPLPQPIWSKIITEKRATFACTPDLPRPSSQTSVDGFFLAGDYVASTLAEGNYPATLEGAVRSGVAAANLCAGYLQSRTH